MCAPTDPREKIHKQLENAGEHVRRASKIAREAGDGSGADDLDDLGSQIQTRTDKFDQKNR